MEVCAAYAMDAPDASTPVPLTEATAVPLAETPSPALLSDLRDIAFKLRAFTETASGGDFALGVEDGMLRAADMVERAIREHWPANGGTGL